MSLYAKNRFCGYKFFVLGVWAAVCFFGAAFEKSLEKIPSLTSE
jgi:hypothetical protein